MNDKTPRPVTQEELQEGLEALKNRQPHRTLCNVIRRIELDSSRGKNVTLLCAEAIALAKRMAKKLREYSLDCGRPRQDDPFEEDEEK